MYRIEWRDGKHIGIGDDGKEEVLFDSRRFLQNVSRQPLHILEEDGTAVPVVLNAMEAHDRKLAHLFDSPAQSMAFSVANNLLTDRLIRCSGIVRVALIDCREEEAAWFREWIQSFRDEHLVLSVMARDAEGYRQRAFDLVVVTGEDQKAGRQLAAASALLKKDGFLLVIAETGELYPRLLSLFAEEARSYEIGSGWHVWAICGDQTDRTLFEEPNLREEYHALVAALAEWEKQGANHVTDEKNEALRRLLWKVDRLADEAVRQEDVLLKQKALDLKEAAENVLLADGDPYEDSFRRALHTL